MSLVDKLHARCGICNAIISLNKKFEVSTAVYPFAQQFLSRPFISSAISIRGIPIRIDVQERGPLKGPLQMGARKCSAFMWENWEVCRVRPKNLQDFAVVNHCIDAVNNLQCIWCGTLVDKTTLVQHFTEIHPNEVQVPKCTLCLHVSEVLIEISLKSIRIAP